MFRKKEVEVLLEIFFCMGGLLGCRRGFARSAYKEHDRGDQFDQRPERRPHFDHGVPPRIMSQHPCCLTLKQAWYPRPSSSAASATASATAYVGSAAPPRSTGPAPLLPTTSACTGSAPGFRPAPRLPSSGVRDYAAARRTAEQSKQPCRRSACLVRSKDGPCCRFPS